MVKKENVEEESHVEWAKKRAHKYLSDGDLKGAVMSMMSDMDKTDNPNPMAGMLGMATLNDPNMNKESVTKFIDGFN